MNTQLRAEIGADLASGLLDHFQLALVDLDAPEETVEEPEQDPARQPEQRHQRRMWN